MSVIIRLQGLPWSASAMNIRHFFSGLSIPAGGVHIIGGEGGDAFIAFSSDDDARMAMKKNMCHLNGNAVQLFLSSKAEMQSVIDAARSGTCVPAAAGMALPQTALAQNSQHRQHFQNMTETFSNQSHNSAGSTITGQQNTDFGVPMPNQFVKTEWLNVPIYAREEASLPANFHAHPRISLHASDARGQVYPQQGKAFQENTSQFSESNTSMQQPLPALGGLQHQATAEGPLTPKQPFLNEALLGRQGNPPAAGNDNPAPLQANMAAVGRAHFPSPMGIGPNREGFPSIVPGKAALTPSMNISGNRASLTEGLVGRPKQMTEKSPDENIDSLLPTETFGNQYGGEKANVGPNGRQKEMLQWSGDAQSDPHFPDGVRPFDQDARAEKPGLMGRDKVAGPGGRVFEKLPYRGELARGEPSDVQVEHGPNRGMEREPLFPGRETRTAGRFPSGQEHGGRFPSERFSDRSRERFADEKVPAVDDSLPSTRFPPDDESSGENPTPGRFPQMRGRPDDARFPPDARRFPPGEPRFLPEDHRMPFRDPDFPPEQDGFAEGDRKFPSGGRGFPSDDRLPPGDRQFSTEDRGILGDDRRFPSTSEGRRFPSEERMGMRHDRLRSEEYIGRRAGENPFVPDDMRFRDREEELRRREVYNRGRRGPDERFMPEHIREGRTGFRDFEEGEDVRVYPRERRFPAERGFRGGEDDDREMRGHPGLMHECRSGMSRWERDRFEQWQEGDENFGRHGAPRGPISNNSDFPGIRRQDQMDGPMDMDQRTGPGPEARRGPAFQIREGPGIEGMRDVDGLRGAGIEGRRMAGMPGFRGPEMEGRGGLDKTRGRGMEGFRGRGVLEAMRGRGMDIMRGRGLEIEGIQGRADLLDENSFDYEHGSGDRGRPLAGVMLDEEFGPHDFDNRFPTPGGRGGMFDRSQRGRGDFYGRVRPAASFGRGRGMGMDQHFEDALLDERYEMDIDARNVGGRPDGPPIRPLMGEQPKPDFSVKPGSGKGLLGDAPMPDKELIPPAIRTDAEKRDAHSGDASRREMDSRGRRSHDRLERDRDHRRGRDRDDRRSGDRDRSRYRYERDRSDRRRSRSRERSSRDKEGGRSRDRSVSNRRDERSESSRGSEQKQRNIYIKNMPAAASYKDVRRFLQPIDVPFDGLKMLNDEQGQRTGEAYVQFRRIDDAIRAIRKNGEKVLGETVNVSFCSDEDYSKAVDSFNPKKEVAGPSAPAGDKVKASDDNKVCYIVQLKNLPTSVNKQDILQFFQGLTVENNGEAVYIELDSSGVPTGIGFVELKSDYDYKKALTQDSSLLGSIAVRVFPGKKEEADELKVKQSEILQRTGSRKGSQPRTQDQLARPATGLKSNQAQQSSPTTAVLHAGQKSQTSVPAAQESSQQNQETVCVHIQGLPLLATPQDIREFFSDCQIAVRGINIAHDSRGKPLGEGFVEFKAKSDFDKAIKKDKTSLGRHIVAVKPIGKKDMLERLENARQRGCPPQQENQQNQNQSTEDQAKSQNARQGPSPVQEKVTNQSTTAAVQQGSQTVQASKSASKPLLSAPPIPSVGMNTGGSKMIPPGVLNKNWFYVHCQNFPPDITIAEIMTFFQGFRPIGESIRLHYSSEGKATGNAVVGFGTPDEARSALQLLNMKKCRENLISLHPA